MLTTMLGYVTICHFWPLYSETLALYVTITIDVGAIKIYLLIVDVRAMLI